MEERNFNDQVIDYLNNASSPMTLESIADEFHISLNRARRSVDELLVGEKIVEFVPDNKSSGRKYYTVVNRIMEHTEKGIVNGAEKIVVQETVNVRDDYKDLSEKIEIIDKNVNGIYANIISIMSIFVGIFALITVNANIAFKLTQENMSKVFWGIIVINAFVVICIIALLIGIRVVLINPMLEKKKKDNKLKGC